jgi:hypothetical protein
MKFIDMAHPEGGRFVVHIDHITSCHYRPGEGSMKSRLGLDLDERTNEIVLFDEEADRVWEALRPLISASTAPR